MSEQPVSEAVPILEELARDQHATPVGYIAELRADVWDSDEELVEFLADWRTSRNASLTDTAMADVAIDTDVASRLQKGTEPAWVRG